MNVETLQPGTLPDSTTAQTPGVPDSTLSASWSDRRR